MIENDLHDKLTIAYLEYFKACDKFNKAYSVRTYYSTRKWLREIQKLAKLRWKEVQDTYADKKQTKR